MSTLLTTRIIKSGGDSKRRCQTNIGTVTRKIETTTEAMIQCVNYGSMASTSEIYAKHASTPLGIEPIQTHSPQLPAPSPNYPVQTQIGMPPMLLSSNDASTCRTQQQQQPFQPQQQQHNVTVAQVPNTNVPININNLNANNLVYNNGNNAPQATSQHIQHTAVDYCNGEATFAQAQDTTGRNQNATTNFQPNFKQTTQNNNNNNNHDYVNYNKYDSTSKHRLYQQKARKVQQTNNIATTIVTTTTNNTNSDNSILTNRSLHIQRANNNTEENMDNSLHLGLHDNNITNNYSNSYNNNATLPISTSSSTNASLPWTTNTTQTTTTNNNYLNGLNINGYVLNVPQINSPFSTTDCTSASILNLNLNINKKPKLSKIDLAAKRRQSRRETRALTSNSKNSSSPQAKPLYMNIKVKNEYLPPPPEGKLKAEDADCVEKDNTEKIQAHSAFEFGVKVYGYSDSSSSSNEDSNTSDSDSDGCNMDLWIRSGPPGHFRGDDRKMGFLNIFGLTTHQEKNEVELKKLERRKWPPSSLQLEGINFYKDDDKTRTDRIIDLPVPFQSPSLLNRSLDFHHKSGFLFGLGLKTVPTQQRQELEKNWLQVVKQRLKRHQQPTSATISDTNTTFISLNKYYLQFGEKLSDCIPHPDDLDEDIILSFPQNLMTLQNNAKFNNIANYLLQHQYCHEYSTEMPNNIKMTELHIPTSFHYHNINHTINNFDKDIKRATVPSYFSTYGGTTLTTDVLTTIPHATLYNNSKNPPRSTDCINGSPVVLNQPVFGSNFEHKIAQQMDVINVEAGLPPIELQFSGGPGPPHAIEASNTGQNMASTPVDEFKGDGINYATVGYGSLVNNHDNVLIWPGVEEIMACYTRYSKEREVEIASLKRKCTTHRQNVYQQQIEVKQSESRQSELLKVTATCNQKRLKLEESIDRLTKIIQDFKTTNR